MNILLLSPYFPPNYYQFAAALRRNGATVLGLGDMPYDELAPELKDALQEYYHVADLHHYDQLIRACGYFTHQYGKLDRIESHNEYWLMTDAALRTDFNVTGPKSNAIEWVKRKSKMKRIFEQAGIEVAPGQVVRDLASARAFIDAVGYPVVAKPDIGVGAAATYKIHDDAALQRFFEDKPGIDYIMEAFVSGALYSFDGLTDKEGNIVFCTSHFFSQGIMETVNEALDMFYYSLRTFPPGLEEVGRKAVEAFNLRERFFHIEFFQKEEGRWIALEVNMRPPGGLTMDMFNYANDTDLYQEWANVVTSNRFLAKYTRPYHCAYVGRKHHRPHTLSHADILAQYDAYLAYHAPIDPVLAPAIGEYGYLVRSPDLAELRGIIDEMLALAE